MNVKNNQDRELFVIDFVQFVSAPQTQAKRVRKLQKTMTHFPDNLSATQWMKMWRGFYYAIWYAEMQKGGQEMIEEMARNDNASYLLSGFKSLTECWQGIDSFRIDKYMYLIRHMLRNVLRRQIDAIADDQILFDGNIFLSQEERSNLSDSRIESVKKSSKSSKVETNTKLSQIIETKANVIDYIVGVTSRSIGLFLHICDLYMVELETAVTERFENDEAENECARKSAMIYYHMMLPFAKRLSMIEDDRLQRSISEDIFGKLFDEIMLRKAINVRIGTLRLFLEPLIEIAGRTSSGKNRNCLYAILTRVRAEIGSLARVDKDRPKLKRRIIGVDRKKNKKLKVKYEIGTSTPFVRSLVPLPLI